jgi:hypothetical protein
VLTHFIDMWTEADLRAGHNESFDMRMVRIELMRHGFYSMQTIGTPPVPFADYWKTAPAYCTQANSTKILNLPPTEKMIKPRAAITRSRRTWPKPTSSSPARSWKAPTMRWSTSAPPKRSITASRRTTRRPPRNSAIITRAGPALARHRYPLPRMTMDEPKNRRTDQQGPKTPLRWGERWTLLLTSPTSGIVGQYGATWPGQPAHYERVNVYAEGAAKLDDIEQYRLQMAAIGTASFGYWKEGDSIHPDYDTVPLRDVARLYAKYDQLYKFREQVRVMVAMLKNREWAEDLGATGDAAELQAVITELVGGGQRGSGRADRKIRRRWKPLANGRPEHAAQACAVLRDRRACTTCARH